MKRAVVTVGLLALVAVGAGCQDKTRESTKREQDRLAMQLATAESARDEARSALDKAQNDAELSRQRVAALEKDLADAKQQSATAAAESVKQVEVLKSKLKESEAALAVSEEEVATQTTRAKELEAQLAKQPEAVKTTTPAASTQPAQEFNK